MARCKKCGHAYGTIRHWQQCTIQKRGTEYCLCTQKERENSGFVGNHGMHKDKDSVLHCSKCFRKIAEIIIYNLIL